MFLFSLIALGVVIAAFALALFSAHIPLLRGWAGAAPLLPEDQDTARDFAAGYVTRPDWGPPPARLALPAAKDGPAAAGEVTAP